MFNSMDLMDGAMAEGSRQLSDNIKINMEGVPEELVFGLDIGTRNIVGTVGYKNNTNGFIVVAQAAMGHQTRAMLDGQIHDIGMVAETIKRVHKRLEAMTGREFKDVCIAAAGRVLKTVESEARIDFPSETVVTSEHIYTLDMLGVENAYETLRAEKQSDDIRFYCVGYSVKHYYQNDYTISNLEGHKSNSIKAELIATFLPDEVVDGLYAAVERAGLFVANLTLEPIAAINVAIPEKFRLLNIALVDVGAGTSDISITKDGSIIAYGMIPSAGDEVTECLARHYLTDFNEADRLKCASTKGEEVEFYDIMGLSQKVTSEEIAGVIEDTVRTITESIADKIISLNGGKSVSAVFVVGGGGKVRGFVESLAEGLGLQKERVALRGSEVLGNVRFMQDNINVDSLLVTPIGICLNYYEQRNNFIFVTINGERIKLYDNSKLTITDAAIQLGFPNEDLFPKRGKTLIYYVNGEKRMLRGKEGETAIIKLNGREASINAPVEQNSKIDIKPSTQGADAVLEIGSLTEYNSNMTIIFNGKEIKCPRFVTVNGSLVSEFYSVKDGDNIEILGYYTLEQVLEFMDIIYRGRVYVNNVIAPMDTKVYDNFSIACEIMKDEPNYAELIAEYGDGQFPVAFVQEQTQEHENEAHEEDSIITEEYAYEDADEYTDEELLDDEVSYNESLSEEETSTEVNDKETSDVVVANEKASSIKTEEAGDKGIAETDKETSDVTVNITVNSEPVILKGKSSYILVDVLDFYPVDTSVAHGDHLETSVNGIICDFVHPVKSGDVIRIEWVSV